MLHLSTSPPLSRVDDCHRTRTVMCAPPLYLSHVDGHRSNICTHADLCCHHASLPATRLQAISWVRQVSRQCLFSPLLIFSITSTVDHHGTHTRTHGDMCTTPHLSRDDDHSTYARLWGFRMISNTFTGIFESFASMSVCLVLSLAFRTTWSFVGSSVPLRGKSAWFRGIFGGY